MGGYGLGDRMSGPITPPLTVTEVDGAPSGRPITTIKVSNGDLTISGNVATIDTTGSGGTPGGSDTEVQWNDGGSFAGDAGFIMNNAGGGSGTSIRVGDIVVGGSVYALHSAVVNGSLLISPEGTGVVTITPNDDAGGTKTDILVNVNGATATADSEIKMSNLSAATASVKFDGSAGSISLETSDGSIVKLNGGANADIDLTPNGTGKVEISGSYTLPTDAGTDTYVMTSDGAGASSWAAASGGGLGAILPYYDTSISGMDTYELATGAPYSIGGATTTLGLIYAGYPLFYPFVQTESGTVSELQVYCDGSSATNQALVGIYDTDTNTGHPDSLLGFATFDLTSTGYLSVTSFSSTITLTANTQYWYAIGNDSSGGTLGTLRAFDNTGSAGLGFGGIVSGYTTCLRSPSSTSLPATFSLDHGQIYDRICVGMVL